MTAHICPNCGQAQGQSLSALIVKEKIDYYLCAKCGTLWTVTHNGQDVIEDLTKLGERLRQRQDSDD